jgi:hypothetical protein
MIILGVFIILGVTAWAMIAAGASQHINELEEDEEYYC